MYQMEHTVFRYRAKIDKYLSSKAINKWKTVFVLEYRGKFDFNFCN
jgi:hypothetical protein